MNGTDLCIKQGNDEYIEVTVVDVDDNTIDITGGKVFFTVKRSVSDSDADALISKTVTLLTNPTNGYTTVHLTEDDTDIDSGDFFYDAKVILDGNITSSYRGRFSVLRVVTQRVS